MRVPRIYTDQALSVGDSVDLSEYAARHISVLRMQAGRELILFNGQGGEYQATLTQTGKKRASVVIDAFSDSERESPLSIHLGIGISRGDRLDLVLQKATELGVTEITPLFTSRTEVKLNAERLEKKQQHWQQVLISACEQCQRNQLPTIHAATAIEPWLAEVRSEARFVLHHRSDTTLAGAAQPESVTLVIGPEGGLSEDEISLATRYQFQPLKLGPRVFRTETAPLAAISVLQFLWGDLS